MKFGILQHHFFKAEDGVYSIVKADERKIGRITVLNVNHESGFDLDALGVGRFPVDGAKKEKVPVNVRHFNGSVFPANLRITVTQSRNELFLYRNARQGFKYEVGDVWFFYRRTHTLFIGAWPEMVWRGIGRIDYDDERYMQSVESHLLDESLRKLRRLKK